MGLEADGQYIPLGAGKLFFDRSDASGNKTGLRMVGNATEMTITTTDEIKEKYSSAEAARPLLASALVRRTVEIGFSLDEYTEQNLAAALMGTVSDLQQTGASVSPAENAGIANVDRTYQFAYPNWDTSPAPVVKIGTTSLTVTTDYTVDSLRGRVYIKSNATTLAACDGTKQVNATYTYKTYAAGALVRILGANAAKIEGMLVFNADNPAGKNWDVEIWHVVLQPDGGAGFIGEDYVPLKFKGKVYSDAANHPNDPSYRLFKRT